MSDRLHPTLAAAARGEFPAWAVCEPERRAHGRRVADLLAGWAAAGDLPEEERERWRAAGLLHDALKDASEEELRGLVGPGWPSPVLHAPACAARLRRDGVRDEELLRAISYHPVGHPDFGDLGIHLYIADFVEPGREGPGEERERLRARMPAAAGEVAVEVARRRILHLLERRSPVLPATFQFWNRVCGA